MHAKSPSSSSAETIAALKQFTLLQGLSETTLEALAQNLERKTFQQHERLFQDGDSGDEVYLLLSGEVRLFLTNASGAEIALEYQRQGAVFGEVAVLQGGQRTATARATDLTEALTIHRERLMPLLKTCPDLTLVLLLEATRRLGRTSENLRTTTARNIQQMLREERREQPESQRTLHRLAGFCGSVKMVWLNAAGVALWEIVAFYLKQPLLEGAAFNLLSLLLVLETLFASCIVLHSQNLRETSDALRDEEEFRANTQTERIAISLSEQVHNLSSELHRLSALTESAKTPALTPKTEEKPKP